jgi:flagella basal body P-ring formation protein FlgA
MRSIALLVLMLCLSLPLSALGAKAAADQPPDQLESWLRQSVKLPNGQQLRIEVEVGTLNRGLKLAPCDKAEPFLPGNARLWGRVNVGLRCVAGARWTTFIPVRISAYGPALVARVMLPAGRIPQPEDFSIREVDWAASRSTPIANLDVLEGRELIRPVAAGKPILTEYLRIAPAVRAGDPIAVVVQGQGFAISTEAVALSTAADGQQVRVRTASGKVLSGTIDGKSVRILR